MVLNVFDFILRVWGVLFFIFLGSVVYFYFKALFNLLPRVDELEEKVEELSNSLESKEKNNEK